MREVLEKNEYLRGFEDILKKHGVTEVYTASSFTNEKRGDTIVYINSTDAAANELSEYMDDFWTHMDDDNYSSEHVSCCMQYIDRIKYLLKIVYKDGVFYTGREIDAN